MAGAYKYVWRGWIACAPATRSRNSRPSQWSISCCSARASNASALIDDLGAGPGQLAADDQPGRALHVAGQVGHGHAALAGLLVAAWRSTTSALQSTKVPWWSRVLGCSETSTQKTLRARPRPAARPDRRSPARPAWSRPGRRRAGRSPGRSGRRSSPGRDSTGSGRPDDREDPATRPSRSLTGRRSPAGAGCASTPSSPATAARAASERGGVGRRPAGRPRRSARRARRPAGWSGR